MLKENKVYLEYSIQQNKPGLLGAVSTLIGMLDINILTVNSIGKHQRGFLLSISSLSKAIALRTALDNLDSIKVTAFREPTVIDYIALKHGKQLNLSNNDPSTYKFIREELGVLVNFLGDTLDEAKNKLIGIRGMPRIGKTEAAIAACVHANKKWILLSSTLIRQTIRTKLMSEELENSIFIIDGITSTTKGNDDHWKLLERVMEYPTAKIIEHPDIFIRDGRLKISYDLIVEIRNKPEDVIKLEHINTNFSSFDLS